MNYSDYDPSYSNKKDGIPKFPLFGYDNAEDMDADVEYIKRIYPPSVRRVLKEVEDQCDKLEYDGSCMFDELPDCVHLGTLVDRIYEIVIRFDPPLEPLKAESLNPAFRPCGPGTGRPCPPPPPPPPRPWPPGPGPCPPGRPCPPPPPPPKPWPGPSPCPPGRPCPPPHPFPPLPRSDFRDGEPDWLRGLISTLLFNEMLHRRRRHRRHKQWV